MSVNYRVWRSVYPRWRGEHSTWIDSLKSTIGLSPLARGTQLGYKLSIRWVRFIPAGAGNTYSQKSGFTGVTVYPRWRGEHKEWPNPRYDGYGLSPLARGTLFRQKFHGDLFRFIPAGAGNTLSGPHAEPIDAVYPRWRGEHSPVATDTEALGGLSPLARGTRRRRYSVPLQSRFIPAGAGNTHTCCSYGAHHSVYPRWRGEHPRWMASATLHYGLSPLARGTLPAAHQVALPARFIPAGAGNTADT